MTKLPFFSKLVIISKALLVMEARIEYKIFIVLSLLQNVHFLHRIHEKYLLREPKGVEKYRHYFNCSQIKTFSSKTRLSSCAVLI